jgi:hypothetical protein
LLKKLLTEKGCDRISAKKALQHPYLASVKNKRTVPSPIINNALEYGFENKNLEIE